MLRSLTVQVEELRDRLDVVYYLVKDSVDRELGQTKTKPLGELCTYVRTKTPARDHYTTSGIPVIKLKNVVGRCLELGDRDHVPDRFRAKYVSPKREDIIITATGEGTAGRADIFLEKGTYIVTGESLLLRPHKNEVNPYYLLAALRSSLISRQLVYFVRGATGQTHLYWKDVSQIGIPIAASDVQEQCEATYLKVHALRDQLDLAVDGFHRQGEDAIARVLNKKALKKKVGATA